MKRPTVDVDRVVAVANVPVDDHGIDSVDTELGVHEVLDRLFGGCVRRAAAEVLDVEATAVDPACQVDGVLRLDAAEVQAGAAASPRWRRSGHHRRASTPIPATPHGESRSARTTGRPRLAQHWS